MILQWPISQGLYIVQFYNRMEEMTNKTMLLWLSAQLHLECHVVGLKSAIMKREPLDKLPDAILDFQSALKCLPTMHQAWAPPLPLPQYFKHMYKCVLGKRESELTQS